MKRILFVCLLCFFAGGTVFADTVSINHFVVKENPFGKDEVAITATDSAGNINDHANGTFTFAINGIDDTLKFDKGTAFYRHKIDKSTFLYIKHENARGTHSTLYYIYKTDTHLVPFHISWILLLIIPILLVLLAYVFKRFIIFAIILFLIFLYFNHHNGLSIPTFFESIFDGLKNMFH
jgi:hypothetical protein